MQDDHWEELNLLDANDIEIFFDELRNQDVAIPLRLVDTEDAIIKLVDPPFMKVSYKTPDNRILFHFVVKSRWDYIRVYNQRNEPHVPDQQETNIL